MGLSARALKSSLPMMAKARTNIRWNPELKAMILRGLRSDFRSHDERGRHPGNVIQEYLQPEMVSGYLISNSEISSVSIGISRVLQPTPW